ncbi:MAG: ABC transporter permease, partial [Promethearchaeota archaeon]
NTIILDRLSTMNEVLKVTPCSNRQFVFGYCLAGCLVGAFQGGMMLLLGLSFQPDFSISLAILLALPFQFLILMFFSSLGIFLASRVSFQNFSLIFALLSIPLVYTSSIFVPVDRFPAAVQLFAYINPISVNADLSRIALLGPSMWDCFTDSTVASLLIDGSISSALFLVMLGLAMHYFAKSPKQTKNKVKKNVEITINGWKPDPELFKEIADLIGRKTLEKLLPAIMNGRFDEIYKEIPEDRVKYIIKFLRDKKILKIKQ